MNNRYLDGVESHAVSESEFELQRLLVMKPADMRHAQNFQFISTKSDKDLASIIYKPRQRTIVKLRGPRKAIL